MLKLQPVKSIQGKVELPPNPDLLFLAALSACALSRTITLKGIPDSTVLRDMRRSLHGHAVFQNEESVLTIKPEISEDPTLLLTLPDSLIVYRTMYLFIALGMGKTVVCRSASSKRIESWIKQAKKIGITLESTAIDQCTGLKVTDFKQETVNGSFVEEEICNILIAFILGKNGTAEYSIDFFLSSPLRHLVQAFGLQLSVKAVTAEKPTDPIMQRIRFLQQKKKTGPSQNQSFSVQIDFTRPEKGDPLEIKVPGDDILGAALISSKCLIPKGSLVLSNVSLESWASQTMAFLRKMGCKLSIQENERTSFGSTGLVSLQKAELYGRKVKCIPLFQFTGQLPTMTITAAFASGQSVFRDLEDMRLDVPDGIDQLESCLRTLGVRHGEMPDGIVMEGARDFDGFDLKEPLPAHIAVAFCVAGLKCMGETSIEDSLVNDRWPDFGKLLSDICELRTQKETT